MRVLASTRLHTADSLSPRAVPGESAGPLPHLCLFFSFLLNGREGAKGLHPPIESPVLSVLIYPLQPRQKSSPVGDLDGKPRTGVGFQYDRTECGVDNKVNPQVAHFQGIAELDR